MKIVYRLKTQLMLARTYRHKRNKTDNIIARLYPNPVSGMLIERVPGK